MLSVLLAPGCFLGFKIIHTVCLTVGEVGPCHLVHITRGGNPQISPHILKGEKRHTFLPFLMATFTLEHGRSDAQSQTVQMSSPLKGNAEKPARKSSGTRRLC